MPIMAGDGTPKSAASRRFVALSAERLAEWMAPDLSKLDLLIIQIDGLLLATIPAGSGTRRRSSACARLDRVTNAVKRRFVSCDRAARR